MFRYVENPEYYDLASGRGLCQQLQASGKSTAELTYDVWGTASRAIMHNPLRHLITPFWCIMV